MVINRTQNTIRNCFSGLVNMMITMIFPFLIRTCIIYILGSKYAGLSSLFTSIISVLSLAELGFGSAIVYSMYQPIADGDNEKICALMNLYKRVYGTMGAIVMMIGLLLLPFLSYIINDTVPQNVNIYILYGIYLLNSVSSYWLFAYKSSLLTAFQRNDILINISTIMKCIMYIIQMVSICMFENYYLYTICIPICNILINIIISFTVDKRYPQYYCHGSLDKEELSKIKRQVIGLLTQRLAYSSRNAFDSIIISSLCGLTVVSIYNNYFLILNLASAMLAIFYTSMQGGIGNSIAKDSTNKNYADMQKFNFMYMWVSGTFTICIFILIQPFMKIWMGDDLLFPNLMVFLFSLCFFSLKLTDIIGIYIAATGIWWRCKLTYLLEAVVNLVLNICLGYILGVTGVILATIISILFVNYISNVVILHKNFFKDKSALKFSIENMKYMIVTFLGAYITYLIVRLFPDFGETYAMLMLVVKMLICFFISNGTYFLMYRKNEQFVISVNWIRQKIKNRKCLRGQ